jgi:hypothetical protein
MAVRPAHCGSVRTGTTTRCSAALPLGSPIDQRELPLSNSFTSGATGYDVHAYVIDTGTHVAGTIGSRSYGVAKQVWPHGVKIVSCAGSTATSAIIDAVD